MTIGAWIGLVVGLLVCVGIATACLAAGECQVKTWVITLVVVLVVYAIPAGTIIWYRSVSESGRRALKDQQSNLQGGIERTVSVYDVNGDLIKEYSGKFDIETDRNSYILFDDEEGKRHVIYYTTGTIVIDEN